MRAVFLCVLLRDLQLASRRRIDALLPLAFFLVALSLFPLGVGPEPKTLREIAPGIVWVCALLASMLSVGQLFAGDLADGSLEQMLLAPASAIAVAAAKCSAHWLLTGLPLIVATPLAGLVFNMSAPALQALVFSLVLGTPILSLLGGLGAALTLGLRSGGMLLILVVLIKAGPILLPFLARNLAALALMVVMVVAALAIGYVLAGNDSQERTTTSLVTSMRNPGLALLLASTHGSHLSGVKIGILAYLLITGLVSIPFLRGRANNVMLGSSPNN
jgi:heme exporter protein B